MPNTSEMRSLTCRNSFLDTQSPSPHAPMPGPHLRLLGQHIRRTRSVDLVDGVLNLVADQLIKRKDVSMGSGVKITITVYAVGCHLECVCFLVF